MSQHDIDWAARRKRALEHLERLKVEWKEVAKKKRPAQYVKYDYREQDDEAMQMR